jgi:translocator assembly and maintenance protein 41
LQLIKYGVISTSEAVDDLLTWRHLYVAGRLHKPVCTLAEQPQVQAANQANMQAAVATALLLSGPTFSTKS